MWEWSLLFLAVLQCVVKRPSRLRLVVRRWPLRLWQWHTDLYEMRQLSLSWLALTLSLFFFASPSLYWTCSHSSLSLSFIHCLIRSNDDIYLGDSLCPHLFSLSLWAGYFSCHALIGTLTHRRLNTEINTMDFLYVFLSWHINCLPRCFLLPLQMTYKVDSAPFTSDLNSFQGLCFYCLLLPSAFQLFKELKSIRISGHDVQ